MWYNKIVNYNKETKNCQNCKQDFVIELDDFSFYEKMKVPPPTFCPECRLQRRLSFRNERSLYKAVCNLCQKNTLSVVLPEKLKVYCVACWVSEKWDPTDYARDYDFSKSFFEQYKELIQKMPNRALASSSSSLINSEYSNTSSNLKDCYLLYGSNGCENCMYSSEIFDCFDCFDCKMITGGTSCYGSVNCQRCSRVNYSIDCRDSLDLDFCRNLSNCSNCFICTNLNNKSYHIFNEPYSREDYLIKIKELKSGSYSKIIENKKIAQEFINKFPVKFYHGFKNNKFSGDYVYNSKNTINSFFSTGAEDCKYCFNLVVNYSKGCFDYSDWGANVENIYESLTCGNNVSNLKFCLFVGKHSMDVEYSMHCANCQNVFGCLGLRNKQYCIFNKQYTREEYFEMVEKIKKHMDDTPYVDKIGNVYKYGEFLPAEISIFPYNDSTAYSYFSLTKKGIEEKGFTYVEKMDKNYKIDMQATDLIDRIEDTGEDVLGKVIECHNKENKLSSNCVGAFRILERELSFYQRENIPLPRFCPNCRHEERSKFVNPPRLWHRACMKEGCTNEFETSYSSDRPEIIYCEECYKREIY
jgi:hypothetical protein